MLGLILLAVIRIPQPTRSSTLFSSSTDSDFDLSDRRRRSYVGAVGSNSDSGTYGSKSISWVD